MRKDAVDGKRGLSNKLSSFRQLFLSSFRSKQVFSSRNLNLSTQLPKFYRVGLGYIHFFYCCFAFPSFLVCLHIPPATLFRRLHRHSRNQQLPDIYTNSLLSQHIHLPSRFLICCWCASFPSHLRGHLYHQ